MGSLMSNPTPEELIEFRKWDSSSTVNIDLPIGAENRVVTDKKGFILFGVALLILLPFLTYTLNKVDLRHRGYSTDNCGNFCGLKNERISGISCSGKDYTEFRDSSEGQCVEPKVELDPIEIEEDDGQYTSSKNYNSLDENHINYHNNQFRRSSSNNDFDDPIKNFERPNHTLRKHKKTIASLDKNRFDYNSNTNNKGREHLLKDLDKSTFPSYKRHKRTNSLHNRINGDHFVSNNTYTIHLDNYDEEYNKPQKPAKYQWDERAKLYKFLLTIIFTIALSILTLVLLRHRPGALIWFILSQSMLILFFVTIHFWDVYFDVKKQEILEEGELAGAYMSALVWTIIASIILIILISLIKKICLVVQLYKETTKVLAAMPMIILMSLLFIFIQVLIQITAIYLIYLMLFARQLNKIDEKTYVYEITGTFKFTIFYFLVIAIWAMKFVAGVQFMIISGCTSKWYFSNNKENLDSPICTNFKIVFKYHLGTIAFGSFLLTLFAVIKIILKALYRIGCCRCILSCSSNVEVVLIFFSQNAYIETGIHGQSFWRSAKRATKLLIANAASMAAVNCVGDFVLGVIILTVTIVATAVSYVVFMDMGRAAIIPTLICFLLNAVIVSIIFASFSTIIDTIFICFCEDTVINDGISRPYFMSYGLMAFMENSKKANENMEFMENTRKSNENMEFMKCSRKANENMEFMENSREAYENMEFMENSREVNENMEFMENSREANENMEFMENSRKANENIEFMENSREVNENMEFMENSRKANENMEFMKNSKAANENMEFMENSRTANENTEFMESSRTANENMEFMEKPRKANENMELMENSKKENSNTN